MEMRILTYIILLLVASACNQAVQEDPLEVAEFIFFKKGNMPLILVSSYGGLERPTWIPDRNCPDAVTVEDARTLELTNLILEELNLLGYQPYVVVNRLHRRKMDANRNRTQATCGDPRALETYDLFHRYLSEARASIEQDFGKGLVIDIHGHGHSIQQLELGYLLYEDELDLEDDALNQPNLINVSSIKHLAFENLKKLSHAQLLRGENSLGTLFQKKRYPSVPSSLKPTPGSEPYFSGGYITANYSSYQGGTIDAIQIECNFEGVRDNDENLQKFSKVAAEVFLDYLRLHYFTDI